MLLDELKIEQDDLKVGDVVYTSHHPNIGVWVSFRYSKMRKEVIQRITPKRTKIVTDYGEYTNRDHFYKMTDELKKQSEIAEAAENICDDLAKIDQFIKKHSYKGIRDEDMLNIKDHMNAVRKILDSYEQEFVSYGKRYRREMGAEQIMPLSTAIDIVESMFFKEIAERYFDSSNIKDKTAAADEVLRIYEILTVHQKRLVLQKILKKEDND